MAHPKSRISKSRKRKRRTHYKAETPSYSICATTGESHLRHRAYYDDDGNLYYKGQLVIEVSEEETES